ncbi:MAG: hypothetical protein AABY16_00090 [Nanoarchaeota archaeon]
MVTTAEIEAIHELIGTRQGYGRNRLTAELEARTPEELRAIYGIMHAYAEDLKRISPRDVISLTDRLILGLEHVGCGRPKDLSTYIEVVCFGQPLEPDHIEHAERRRTTHEGEYNGRNGLAAVDCIEEDEL